MDDSNLFKEIQTFQRYLPAIRREHGDVWAVVSGDKVEGTFGTFKAAAEFTITKLGGAKVLIRHTNAPQPHIPFVALEA